jgi:hypothetical protein
LIYLPLDPSSGKKEGKIQRTREKGQNIRKKRKERKKDKTRKGGRDPDLTSLLLKSGRDQHLTITCRWRIPHTRKE